MKKRLIKLQSVVLAIALMLGVLGPGLGVINTGISALAASYAVDICDSNGNSITEKVEVPESEQYQLTVKLVDCSMPDGGYYTWTSEAPLTASVDNNGLVRAHDSSKGAAVRIWLDNDVRTISIVGPTLANTLEKILFNDNVNIDTMDTEQIVALVQTTLDATVSSSVSSYLVESLRDQLNNLDTDITVTLYAKDGTKLASDTVHILVTNSDTWYSYIIPNGAFITNKDSLPTTVAVGGSLKLEGGVTPLRLGYGVTWSLKTDSIWKNANDYAKMDGDTITFLKEGTVTVTVSPNADQVVDKLLSYINQVIKLGNEVDTGTMAEVLVKVMGLDVSASVVKTTLDILVAVAGMGTNSADLVAAATKAIANYLLKATINDSITFTIVDSLNIESFDIGGETEVTEGKTSQLYLTNIVPKGANSQNILWSVADPSIAYVDENGILIGRDAGGISSLNKKTTTVTARVGNVVASKEVTVKGSLLTAPVDIAISGPANIEIGETGQYTAKVFPSRVSASVTWGIINDDGEAVYASGSTPATNSKGSVSSSGVLTGTNGGTVRVVAKAAGTLGTITRTYTVYIGTLVSGISIDQGDFLSVQVPTYKLYYGYSTTLSASFNPPDAGNKNVAWSVISGKDNIEVNTEGKVSISKYNATYGVVQAKSYDGGFTDTIVVSFANYPVTGVKLNASTADMVVGNTKQLEKTVEPTGTLGVGKASIDDAFWTSSDPSVATVDGNGVVTAVNSGTAVITVTTWDGGKTASCEITVRPDKTALNYAIQLIDNSGITEDSCTPEDWEALQKAYNEGKQVQAQEFVDQSICDTAAREIIAAYDSIGGYIRVYGVNITKDGQDAPEYNAVKVSTLTSYKNVSLQLGCSLTPENAMYASIVWSSDNSGLKVDSTGKVTPTENKAAAAKITVKATDYTGTVVTDYVYVSFANTPVTGVSLDKTSITDALVRNTGTLEATVEPKGVIGIAGASNKDVKWTSSDANVVTVDGGNLTYVGTGTAVVTVTTLDGGYTASCNITVSVNKTDLNTAIQKVQNGNVTYDNYTNDSYENCMSAYNQAVAVYNDVNATQETIDAVTATLNSAFDSLQKFIKAEGVLLQYDGNDAGEFVANTVPLYTTYTSASVQLDAKMHPLDANIKTVEWSSNTDTISVDQSGKCTPTAKKACYGVITVKVTDEKGNTVTDSVYVSFANYTVTSVEISKTSITANLDDAPQTLTAKCKSVTLGITYDSTIQNVIWSSTNPDIVSVDGNGKLTYKNAGQATITATSVDAGKTASCVVTIGGNKATLRAAISQCEAMNINVQDYTPETSSVYQQAYDHAKAVEADVIYTQEQIDAAAAGLLDAMNNLTPYIHMERLTIYKEDGSVAPDFIQVKLSWYALYTSQIVRLNYDFAPANAMYDNIKWASSSSDVTVSDTGKVEPKSEKACGALITLTATDHYGNTIVKGVFVSFVKTVVTSVSLDKTSFVVPYGAAGQKLNATVEPNKTIGGADFPKLAWISTDTDVATVDQDGNVTFVEAGTCVIKAMSIDGGKTATCTVTVNSDISPLQELYAMVNGMNLNEKDYTEESWSALVEAMDNATAVLAVTNPKQRDINAARDQLQSAYDNLEKYIKIQDIILTKDGVDFFGTHISQKVDLLNNFTKQSVQLGYRLLPSDATFASAVWSSSNPSKLTVDQSGKVVPADNKACGAYISINITDFKGNVYSEGVYVAFANYQVTGVSVSPTDLSGNVGSTATIQTSVTPAGTAGIGAADVKNVVWTSSDNSIATVSDGGVVTFVNTGKAVITATTVDGGYKAQTTVTVYANKTDLISTINAVRALSQYDYTPATWTALQTELASAISVNALSNPTQAEVNAATDKLVAAINALVLYVYVNDIAVVYNEEETDFVSVVVPQDGPYITAVANLSFMVKPSNAMYTKYEWSSTGDVVVNFNGAVAPKLNQACYGTVKLVLTDDFGNTYDKTVFVAFSKNPAASVTLDQTYVNTYPGAAPIQLTANVRDASGNAADINNVIWSSDNTNVVTVDNNGLVTIVNGGIATITAKTVVGGYTATCTFDVGTDKTELVALVNTVQNANYQQKDYVAETYEVFASALNNAIAVRDNAHADQNSINNAINDLNYAVSALVRYNYVSSVNLTYNGSNAPTHISTKVELWEKYTDKSVQLGAVINPSDAMYVSATWRSDDSSVTVDQSGKCKPSANKAAHAHITYTVVDHFGNEYVAMVTVAFANYQVTSVKLDKSEATLSVGGSTKLTPTIEPAGLWGAGGASVTAVTYTSSNPSVAAVNQDGTITAIDGGTATITCSTDDGGKTAKCTVNVISNKDALKAAIDAVAGIVEAEYTTERYAVFKNALTNANTVYGNPYASSTDIQNAITALTNAKNALVYKLADYSAVNSAVAQANALDSFLYTADSYQAVMNAVNAVVYNKKASEQTAVDAMAQTILTAISNLKTDSNTKIEGADDKDTVIDETNKLIYGVSEGLDNLNDYIRVLNGSVECVETENGLGTGTTVKVKDEHGNVVGTYTLVIFGDVDGDGVSTAEDANMLRYYIGYNSQLSDAEKMAADINGDGIVDESDAICAELAGVFMYEISQVKNKK